METPVKYMCVLVFLVSMAIAGLNGVEATGYYYGPCGKHDIDKEAEKLEPCTYAAQHWRAPVSQSCCTVMEKKVKNPACLCAVLFSQTAYNAGVRPEIAVSIPKRCNIVDRPVGYKCGVAARLSEVKNNDPKKSWANWDYNILIITMLETSQLSPVPSLPSNLQSLFRVLEHVGKPIYFPNDATPSPWPGH
ncbi:hypothetical protein V6N11_066041 [Hibiscus sabdariffa]|uniref:Bifunctional inhibitor/plant lipid transfer protein/seed storage helical domain-containing protein n=2 Tax=Hibiscus sabdariffa TaxID=183260 RepID=A0ABR2NUQ1_9ROSI